MAAISNNKKALDWIHRCLEGEDLGIAYSMIGIDGMSPLHLATKAHNLAMVQEIIQYKPVRASAALDFWRRSAIHLAASFYHPGVISDLIRDNLNIEATDEMGKTPLEYFFKRFGELHGSEAEDSECEESEDQDSEDQDSEDEDEEKHALVSNTGEIVPTYDQNSDPEQTPQDGNVKDPDNHDAGFYDRQQHHTTQTSKAKDNEDDDEKNAESDDDPGCSTEKLDRGPTLADQKRKTFIEIASKKPDYRDNEGRTILHYAVEHTDMDTIGELISKGHDLEAKDANARTPLHHAIYTGRQKIAMELIRPSPFFNFGAVKVFAKDNKGHTPLMLAAERGYKPVVEYLVETLSSTTYKEPQIAPPEKKNLNRDKSSMSPDTDEDQSGILARNYLVKQRFT